MKSTEGLLTFARRYGNACFVSGLRLALLDDLLHGPESSQLSTPSQSPDIMAVVMICIQVIGSALIT
jgi:hypothetical protein